MSQCGGLFIFEEVNDMRTETKHKRTFDPRRCTVCRRYVDGGEGFLERANHRERRHLEVNNMLPRTVPVRDHLGRGRYKTFGGYFQESPDA